MGRIVVTEFITLDGVVEDPGGSEGTPYGGWAFKFERGAEGDAFKYDETMSADAMLLGRVTYEGFAAAWPGRSGDEFSDRFNSMPKFVVSGTLTDPSWENTKVISLADVEGVRDEAGELLVHGSVQLVRALVERDLVDSLRLMVFPFLAGGGKRLLGDTGVQRSLRLDAVASAGETVTAVYERPRA